MEYILIPTLFYLPVFATVHLCPIAGMAVSTGYLAYHYWTRRISKSIKKSPTIPFELDTLEVRWDAMEIIRD